MSLSSLKLLREGLDSLLLPAACAACGLGLESPSGDPLCAGCLGRLSRLPAPPSSGRGGRYFDRAVSAGPYEGVLRELIIAFKYRGQTRLAPFLAGLNTEALRRPGKPTGWDAVVPVPLHPVRQRQRGFNQAALLGKETAARLGIPLRLLLVRRAATRSQTELSLAERRRNVRGAFALHPGSRILPRRILLVDDVLTSGFTADACARVLKTSGADQVTVVTVASG